MKKAKSACLILFVAGSTAASFAVADDIGHGREKDDPYAMPPGEPPASESAAEGFWGELLEWFDPSARE